MAVVRHNMRQLGSGRASARPELCVGALLIVDSHAHLGDAAFALDREAVISRAVDAGVTRVVVAGTNLETSRQAVALARRSEGIMATVGLHPSEAASFDAEWPELEAMLTRDREAVCAVGEVGLDYYRCTASRDEQLTAFRAQLRWAVEHGLPVVIHDRDAHDDVLAQVGRYGARGVLHCFSGSEDMVDAAVGMGLYVSFAGNITYPKATRLREVARHVPLDALLAETDAPFLAPQPWRGRRNEPAHIVATVQMLGDVRGMTVDAMARVMAENAQRLFGCA